MPNPTHQLVDQLLQSLGRYDPIELLLCEGRLLEADYQAWYYGDVQVLDDVLMGSIEAIQAQLEEASAYSQQLNLESEYDEVVGGTELPANSYLLASENSELDQLLRTHYLPSRQRPQLDLFMDTPANVLSTKIQKAISEHQLVEANQLLEQLYDIDPGCADLGGFERLLDALTQEQFGAGIAEQLHTQESEVTPLAKSILGKYAASFLQPLWADLSNRLEASPYDPNQPQLHQSYTEAKTQNWQGVQTAIEQEPAWQHHSELLKRHLQAATNQNDEQTVLLDYLMICWQCPELIVEIPVGHLNGVLPRAVSHFQSLKRELESGLFPAWLLLHSPGLVHRLPQRLGHEQGENGVAWSLMHQLQSHTDMKQQLELRAKLRRLSVPLFELYMDSV